MRFLQYLNELFTTKMNVQVVSKKPHSFESKFFVGDVAYWFNAFKDQFDAWEVEFVRDDPQAGFTMDILSKVDKKDVLMVFSGVKQAFEFFLKTYKPDGFRFYAKEAKRKPLYRRFAKQLKQTTDYDFEINKIGGTEAYVFARKGTEAYQELKAA